WRSVALRLGSCGAQSKGSGNGRSEAVLAVIDDEPEAVEEVPECAVDAECLRGLAHVADIARAIGSRGGDVTIIAAQSAELAEQDARAVDAVALRPGSHALEVALD